MTGTTPEANRPLTGDGWIEWTGGENPVPGQVVDVELRNGFRIVDERSDDLAWPHHNNGGDIIAYRLTRPDQPEPERDALDAARYMVGNPSAWDNYDERASEALRHVLSLLSTAERQRDEAVRALAPFAATGAVLDSKVKDDAIWAGQRPADPITFGDFRRAHQTIQSIGSGE